MESYEIANILYNLALDLDYGDYIEFSELEIEEITEQIEQARDSGADSLISCLENVAMQHADLLDLHKRFID